MVNKTKTDEKDLNKDLFKLRVGLCKLIAQSIEDSGVRYENKQLAKCWEVKNCGKKECPSYESENLRCWQVAGTFCGGQTQGAFAQKYNSCKECEVFKGCTHKDLDAIGEHFNNLLHMLDEKVKKVETLNHELLVVESLILKAATDPKVRYVNINMQKCWEILACAKKECPAFNNANLRCWQLVGTFCGGKVEGQHARKLGDCQKCRVFQSAGRSEASAIGEQFNNMMFLLDLKKRKVDALNKELIGALDNLDRKNNEILRLTVTDNLTGLYSRNYLFKCLDGELERSKHYTRPLSLFVIDIDGFKGYNDTYGHLAGDILLKKFGELIRNSVRSTDIACRFGGDEFIIVLPETNQTIAMVVAERIRKIIKAEVFYPQPDDKNVAVSKTCSIGVYTVINSEQNGENQEIVIGRADEAMYKAKEDGGDRVEVSCYVNEPE